MSKPDRGPGGSAGSGDRGSAPSGPGRAAKTRAARRQRAADGFETVDGAVIGRDPRRLSTDELRALGHRGKPLLQAIRRRCVDCCSGKKDEVRRCTATACPLWPYRMATDPWHAPAAEKRASVSRPAEEAAPGEPAAPAPLPAATAPSASAPVGAPEAAAAPRRSPTRRRGAAAAEAPLLPFLDEAPAA